MAVLSLRRALAKPHVRVIAVDDGAFRRDGRYAPLAVVVVSSPQDVEGVHLGRVRVDGDDATASILALLRDSPHRAGARALLLDGIAVGGFNLLDLNALYRGLRMPVISVTRRPPDFERIRAALKTYFPRDFRRRWNRVTAHRLFRVPTAGQPILAAAVGCSCPDAVALLHRLAVHGYWPEPLRLAHLIAHAAGTPAPSADERLSVRPRSRRSGL